MDRVRALRRRDFHGLALAACGAGLARHANAQENSPGLSEYFERLDRFGYCGGAFVIEEDRRIWASGCGWADKARRERFDLHSRFDIASLSKPLTALTVLSLLEAGALSLGDGLDRFLPTAPPDKAGLTLHQLLSGTAGLVRQAASPRPTEDKRAVLDRILAEDLVSAPGERFRYSNDGYRLLAAVVEAVEGASYRDVVRARVFQPAGMTESGFVQDPPRGGVNSRGYNGWKDLGDFALPVEGWDEGAGNIVSTLDNLSRFVLALQSGRIVSPATLETAMTAHAFGVGDSDYAGYGYGWYVGAGPGPDLRVMHGGDKKGYHCELHWQRARGRWIFVQTTNELYDTSGFGLGLHMRRARLVMERILDGAPFTPPPPANPVTPATALRLVGDYGDGQGVVRLERIDPADPHLTAIALGQSAADAVTGVTQERAAQLAAANLRTLAFADLIVQRNKQALQAALGGKRFFAEAWASAFEVWTGRHGAWRAFGPVTSRSTPLEDDQIRTWLPLDFDGGRVVMEFTWNDGELFETLADTGTPSSVVLPAAMAEDGTLVIWDMATNARTPVTVHDDRLIIGGRDFQRV